MEAWVYRLPRVARFAFLAAVMFAVLVGVLELESRLGIITESLVLRLVLSAVIAVAAAGFSTILAEQRLRRDFGSIEQFIGFRRALRTGELPARIDPDVWRSWVKRSSTQSRWPLVAALGLVVVAFVSLIGRSAHHWADFSFFAVVAIYFLVLWQLGRARISRLATAVEQRAAESPTD